MNIILFFMLVLASLVTPVSQEASGCNVCHSKNPKMVRMHEELGLKDCFKCHGQGLQKTAEGRKAQMLGDERCTSCHKK